MGGILVVYASRSYPLRATIADHLYSFRRHSGRPCYYLNLSERRVSRHLFRLEFDAIVFHTTFLSERWNLAKFRRLLDRARPLRNLAGVKIALPQDEFFQADALEEFLQGFGVTHVFSVMPEWEWPKIYPKVDHSRVTFSRVLTGYLEEETLVRIEQLAARRAQRDIDIGYRAWRAAPWLGRHGILKADLAEVFQRRAVEASLRVDISTRNEDVLLGDTWYEFLLRCRYTLGVEGGASILDRDGSIRRRTDEFMRENPGASFLQIERACFSGVDGSAHLVAISPRHLEACATHTCQVLVEGDYNGILKPGVHYIPLKRDFSNVDEVLDLIRQDTLRREMTDRAHQDIVTSAAYTYRHFVQRVLGDALGGANTAYRFEAHPPRLLYAWGAMADRVSWMQVRFWVWCLACVERLPLPLQRIAHQVRRRLRELGRRIRPV